MANFREQWPDESITPKLHILEDHVVPFLMKWKCGFGFYGEQGGESLHNQFNKMKHRFNNIKNPQERLRCLMRQHLLTGSPHAQSLRPAKRKLNEAN